MILFPNCKINLGLHVTGKRPDGYHDLETVFYPVMLQDALEIVGSNQTTIQVSGLNAGDPADNICLKAWALLKKAFPQLPEVAMHLHKTIPSGAGLGGGSADAAFTLRLLDTKYRLGLTTEQLLGYALQLGSDCPFFIVNKPCLATGRGERLQEIDVDLSAYRIVLVNPGITISTAWAFQQLRPAKPACSLDVLIQKPIEAWKEVLLNDFQVPIAARHPQIGACIQELYGKGALYAAMSGSGSTVYGIFPKQQALQFSFPLAYFVKEC